MTDRILYRNEDVLYNNNTFDGLLMEEYLEMCDTFALGRIIDRFVDKGTVLRDRADKMLKDLRADDLSEDVDQYDGILTDIKNEIGRKTGITPNYIMWLEEKDEVLHDNARFDDGFIMCGYDVSNAVILTDWHNVMWMYGFEEEPKAVVTRSVS